MDTRDDGERVTSLVRIVAPHFVAGVVYDATADRITITAPIVRYMIGWTGERAREYCKAKGWRASILETKATIPNTSPKDAQQ